MSPAALPTRWAIEALRAQLNPLLPGLAIEVLAETDSTNTALLDRARGGMATQPCLLVAERQTAGRGRQGRVWQALPGASLTFSVALPLAPASWAGLSLVVGLALADALDPPGQAATGARRLGIKWPNDLLLHDPARDAPDSLGRKLGGILIETVQAGAQRVAVIGIGLNLQPLAEPAVPGTAPPTDAAAFSQGRASLAEWLPGIDGPTALARVAPGLLRAVRAFERGGFAPWQAGFAQRDLLAGRPVSTTLPGLPQGVADGVDDDGTLWLRVAGQRHAVGSGEVSVRALPAQPLPGGAPC